MITAFFTNICIASDGSIAQRQDQPRGPFAEIILGEVIEGDLVCFTCVSGNESVIVIDTEDGQLSEADRRLQRMIKDRFVEPDTFVSRFGTERIKKELVAGTLERYPTGSSDCQPVVALDIFVRGPKACLNHAINMRKPEHFFEALEAAHDFYPQLEEELRPFYGELAKGAFKGAKGQDLTNNQGSWEERMERNTLQKDVLVEAIILQMLDFDGRAARTMLSESLMEHVLLHPKISEIEAFTVGIDILNKARGMGVKFKADPERSPVAFRNSAPWVYIEAGYDWRLLPDLTAFSSDQGCYGRLAQYIVKGHGAQANLSTDSHQFWEENGLADASVKLMVGAISRADPIGFAKAFDLLTQRERLACVALGFVDRTWIDLETVPQAGLASLLESDLGL